MVHDLLTKLEEKSITEDELIEKAKQNTDVLSELLHGVSSSKAAIRYGCGKTLMILSEKYPEKLYQNMDSFIALLDSKYRILTWQAMAIIANLTSVDVDKKFDAVFKKYYGFINDEYMVTVANVVGHSGKIAVAKPYLIQRITNELLKIEHLSTTPHLTKECKLVIAEKAIESFDMFFSQIDDREKVLSFVKNYSTSSRRTLKQKSEKFLNKWETQTH